MSKTPAAKTLPADPAQEPSAQEPSGQDIARFLSELEQQQLKPSRYADLIGILQQVQQQFGYLPAEAIRQVSRRTKVPLSRVYGVVSFYAQFYTEPRGRHTIRCCRGTACHVKGADRIVDTIRQLLGIDEGQTTPDKLFYLEAVACLGTCFLAPVMMIDNQYFGNLTPQRVQSVLDSYRTTES
ncbi:MAG: NADH-quinone oxidoreductase subunit NuoE [Planctomycetota bacterium]|nr:NADH-quinone oxidoreductase subunit NuoE [Planctomycetota bacterium]